MDLDTYIHTILPKSTHKILVLYQKSTLKYKLKNNLHIIACCLSSYSNNLILNISLSETGCTTQNRFSQDTDCNMNWCIMFINL